ncbi:MAG: Rieske (2Fe-2S) protein [Verrucomicrobiota bacterium]|nr:Rieske (2Fe-2S) protein [Verrucomicrobiota bacterium]MDP7048174.1 Rieske (2Fe-2S) protein [Verrucomicrobiota bacterium]
MERQINRRGALRTLLFTSVCAGACGAGSGRWFVSHVQAGESALFRMAIDDFPQLKQSYGSVRLRVPGVPSSNNYIIVTRMPGNQFYAVSALCTHRGVALEPFKKGAGLRCLAHGSQFDANGKVVKGPARSSLKSYSAAYNGHDAVNVKFPNIGYSVATELVEAGAGERMKLEFETLTGMEYSVQVRGTVNGVSSALAKFALTPAGSLTKTSLSGNGKIVSLYIAPNQNAGFITILRE